MPIYDSELEGTGQSPNRTPDCLRSAASIVRNIPGAEIWWVDSAAHYYVLFPNEERVGNVTTHVPRMSAKKIREEGRKTNLSKTEIIQLLE
ncbi:MAG: hypothetical protein ABIA11_03950 [Patescibacteria group bacterium]|nr:hypothetical protein [Patescibacteria group bacterium]